MVPVQRRERRVCVAPRVGEVPELAVAVEWVREAGRDAAVREVLGPDGAAGGGAGEILDDSVAE